MHSSRIQSRQFTAASPRPFKSHACDFISSYERSWINQVVQRTVSFWGQKKNFRKKNILVHIVHTSHPQRGCITTTICKWGNEKKLYFSKTASFFIVFFSKILFLPSDTDSPLHYLIYSRSFITILRVERLQMTDRNSNDNDNHDFISDDEVVTSDVPRGTC